MKAKATATATTTTTTMTTTTTTTTTTATARTTAQQQQREQIEAIISIPQGITSWCKLHWLTRSLDSAFVVGAVACDKNGLVGGWCCSLLLLLLVL